MDRPIHVVGAGIDGLVAAVTEAEAGAPVVVHEAATRTGGRALGGAPRAGVNLGPHVLFTDGALVRWLRMHGVRVPLRVGPPIGLRVLDDGGLGRPLALGVQLAPTVRRRRAPADESFREWAVLAFGPARAALVCRLAGLFTFHHDPGSLSAAFVWERYRRTFLSPDRVRWVAGGWTSLVDALESRARALGVVIERGERVTAATLPDGPTVVAVPLANASRLLDRRLEWPGARTALLDVAAERGARWPALVADIRSDLATCCMIERETAVERRLMGDDRLELFQAHLGIGPELDAADGLTRIEDAFDRAVGHWRDRAVWRRGHVVIDATGAVDPPGTTWRDRPALEQGAGRFLAGDMVAAPGMLSEVAVNSAVRAAHLALEARRRAVFAVGWPSVTLTPERRFAVLSAAVDGARLQSAGRGADAGRALLEPVDETGPGYRLELRRGTLRGTAESSGGAGLPVRTLRARRWRSQLPGRRRRAPGLPSGAARLPAQKARWRPRPR